MTWDKWITICLLLCVQSRTRLIKHGCLSCASLWCSCPDFDSSFMFQHPPSTLEFQKSDQYSTLFEQNFTTMCKRYDCNIIFSPTLSNLDVFGTPFRCPMHPHHGDRNRWHFRCISCYPFLFFNFFESKSELLRQTSRKLSGNLDRLDVIADHFERLVYSSYICLLLLQTPMRIGLLSNLRSLIWNAKRRLVHDTAKKMCVTLRVISPQHDFTSLIRLDVLMFDLSWSVMIQLSFGLGRFGR